MKKWSNKKKITILLLFLVLLALFAGLCWKKRRGIYNTYMKLTNQEIPYSVKEKRKKKYGYYGQKLNVTMDVDDTISIQENDDSRMISRQKSLRRKHWWRPPMRLTSSCRQSRKMDIHGMILWLFSTHIRFPH